MKSNSRLHTGPPQIQTQHLRALAKHPLNSGSSGCAHCPGYPVPCPPPSGADPFPNTPSPPLTQLHAVPSGPVAVTQSRAQRCPSPPCEELQPPWGLPSAPLLCAEHTGTSRLLHQDLFITTPWQVTSKQGGGEVGRGSHCSVSAHLLCICSLVHCLSCWWLSYSRPLLLLVRSSAPVSHSSSSTANPSVCTSSSAPVPVSLDLSPDWVSSSIWLKSSFIRQKWIGTELAWTGKAEWGGAGAWVCQCLQPEDRKTLEDMDFSCVASVTWYTVMCNSHQQIAWHRIVFHDLKGHLHSKHHPFSQE